MNVLPCITLNRYAQERLKRRHPWIFSNEIADMKQFQKLEPGSLVDVLDCHGAYVATGFINPKSLIAVRVLSRKRGEVLDQSFFRQKISYALEARETFYGEDSGHTYRAIFGESDGLPGLVVDRFQGAWVMEHHALGSYLRRKEIAAALAELSSGVAIVSRTDNRAASLEGMQAGAELLAGEIPKAGVFAVENGLRFSVDPLMGQKTGFFFDQRENRKTFSDWVRGSTKRGQKVHVLDTFCHAGAWGLGALKAGADKAVFVDSSAAALEMVSAAASAAGLSSKVECRQGDAQEIMKSYAAHSFSAVVVDPPALIPSKKDISAGLKNYRDLNREAFRLVNAGGVLSTSSCSYHCAEDRFEEMVARASAEANRSAQILDRGGMAHDHPLWLGMEEGRYLKNLFLRVE